MRAAAGRDRAVTAPVSHLQAAMWLCAVLDEDGEEPGVCSEAGAL